MKIQRVCRIGISSHGVDGWVQYSIKWASCTRFLLELPNESDKWSHWRSSSWANVSEGWGPRPHPEERIDQENDSQGEHWSLRKGDSNSYFGSSKSSLDEKCVQWCSLDMPILHTPWIFIRILTLLIWLTNNYLDTLSIHWCVHQLITFNSSQTLPTYFVTFSTKNVFFDYAHKNPLNRFPTID